MGSVRSGCSDCVLRGTWHSVCVVVVVGRSGCGVGVVVVVLFDS
jgi:hypothetical protein